MAFFDIHSHILPAVDDGAKTVEDSVKLLEMLKEQGVGRVALTPHFEATYDNMEDFIERVEIAKKDIKEAVKGKDLPELLFGAEVLFFKGMSRAEGIERVCYENSKYMLIEFAEIEFGEKVIDELKYLKESRDIIPIIAHIERYADFKQFDNLLKLVENKTVYAQVNASAFFSRYYKKAAIKLIKKCLITFIGSDTHSVEHRPPYIKDALLYIEKKFDKETAQRFIKNSERFFETIR